MAAADSKHGYGVDATIGGKAFEPSVKYVFESRDHFETLASTAAGAEVGSAFTIMHVLPQDRVIETDLSLRVHYIQDADTYTTDVNWVIGAVVKTIGSAGAIDFDTDTTEHVASKTETLDGSANNAWNYADFTLAHSTQTFTNGDKVYFVIARNGEVAADTYVGSIYVTCVEIGHEVIKIGS